MNILKAFLLTALLMVIELALSYPVWYFADTTNFETNSILHLIGISGIVPYSISFIIVLFFISKMKLKWDNGIKKVKSLNLEIVIYLLIMNIGLYFFDRPCFDFTRILDTINNVPIEPYTNYQGSNISLFYRTIAVLFIAPIFEELFFRKYLFVELSKKYSSKISIIISSICFSLIHLPSYRNLIPTFLFGVICCLIYSKTRNILYTILIHFLSNLTWLLTIKFGANIYNWVLSLEYNYLYWVLVLSGILIVYFSLRKITTANNVYN
ncbi:CPBP family intramembrane glutamic endopeptidase [Psychroserpens ponticola]|uniref:CPBP family intramembrane metalloprotease n=1 Tax=Psychroserpens ponticola TaxID=2932268 RepID=A0ABY7S3L9_9FLAO|nr:CPBP family intramembrane glutamic endopeptidase [Psychroserpens ponticola]WCO03572.1 CPBP family intramembrane metalloprotease [Psychroserpens ponticola]